MTKLTREQIAAMTADELRLAVAEYVMGFEWVPFPSRNGFERLLLKGSHPTASFFFGYRIDGIVSRTERLPNYPSDISAAWQVIVSMQKRGWFYVLWDVVQLPEHGCKFYALDKPDVIDIDENICAAICRAALMAVMSEME